MVLKSHVANNHPTVFGGWQNELGLHVNCVRTILVQVLILQAITPCAKKWSGYARLSGTGSYGRLVGQQVIIIIYRQTKMLQSNKLEILYIWLLKCVLGILNRISSLIKLYWYMYGQFFIIYYCKAIFIQVFLWKPYNSLESPIPYY